MKTLAIAISIIFCALWQSVLSEDYLNEESLDSEVIQLLDFDSSSNGTVTIAKGSVEKLFLNEVVANRNVVLISIAGAFRKGKSFLLNYMLRYMYANYKSVKLPDNILNGTIDDWLGDKNEPLTGFPWKSSTKRETTGIIFWSDVFLYDADNEDGDKLAIYLIDTQGLFDHNSSPTDNIRIFSLSALMSSVQLMNIYSMIEENHLEYLQFATEYARFSAVEQSSTGTKPFQKMMFIIRDWISPDEYNYGLKGGKAFIKSFLEIKDFQKKELKDIRKYLQNTFDSIDCFLMPYPGKIVARNSSYNGRWADIDEEFIDAMKEMFPIFLAPSNLTVKTINNNPVKAFELAVFIKKYVELFKSENLPEAKSIYESTLDNQFQILMSKAVEVYLHMIQSHQPNITQFDQVAQLHNSSLNLALKYFDDERKFGNLEEGFLYRNELESKLEKAFIEWAPLTIDHLNKILLGQENADKQVLLTIKAQNLDDKAKSEVRNVNREIEGLKQMIEQSRTDNEESRHEVEELRQKLTNASRAKQIALQKEQETRAHLEEMRKRAIFLEQQLAVHRQQASKEVEERVIGIRKKHGVLQWFEDAIANTFKFFAVIFQSVF